MAMARYDAPTPRLTLGNKGMCEAAESPESGGTHVTSMQRDMNLPPAEQRKTYKEHWNNKVCALTYYMHVHASACS